MRAFNRLFLIVACSAALAVGKAVAADKITVSGDPCSLELMQRMVAAFKERHRGFNADYTTVPCMLGVHQAANGQVDVGVSTQNGLEPNLPRGAVNHIIAKAPIVLIVNKANPIDNLSYQQLQGIFAGEITNWKEVGGPDEKIQNVMLEPCVMHTMSKKVSPYGKEISRLTPEKKVNPVAHTNVMVAENSGAIGQQLFGYESADVKVLKIDGVLPSEQTLGDKSYTFYEEYNIVTNGAPKGAIEELIAFAYSPEGERIITAMKHVPVRR